MEINKLLQPTKSGLQYTANKCEPETNTKIQPIYKLGWQADTHK